MSVRPSFIPPLTAALFLPLAAAVGCGSSASTTAAPGTSVARPTAQDATSSTLDVRMHEWAVEPDFTSVKAGRHTIKAANEGGVTHELAVFKTDLPVERLPLNEEGAVDERGAGVELVDEVENVAPGTSKSFTVELAPGRYLLVCNLVEGHETHFANKMYAPLTVT